MQTFQKFVSFGTLAVNGFTFVALKEENCVIFFSPKQGCILIYIRDSWKLIFSFLDGALISWSPVGSRGLLKGQSLHKHTVSAISSRDDDSSLKSSRYMSPHVIFPTLWIFLLFWSWLLKYAWRVTLWFSGITNVRHFVGSYEGGTCGNFFVDICSRPLRGRRGRNAATLRQAPWPCCFIILLTVVLRVLKYWTEHEKWWPPSLPSLVVLFKVAESRSHASAPGLFRLTPWTITLVKEKEICVFTSDKYTLRTAPAGLSTSLSPR